MDVMIKVVLMTHKASGMLSSPILAVLILCETDRRKKRVALLLHVEFDAVSESTATKILECLASAADIVYRGHPKVYTYVLSTY